MVKRCAKCPCYIDGGEFCPNCAPVKGKLLYTHAPAKDIEITTMENALKYDSDKPPISLIPRSALLGAANVLNFGKQKYAAHNWRKGMEWSRLIDATLRHLMAFNEGEDKDSESNLNHLHHALVDIMFLCEYYDSKLGKDDRFKK